MSCDKAAHAYGQCCSCDCHDDDDTLCDHDVLAKHMVTNKCFMGKADMLTLNDNMIMEYRGQMRTC